MNHVAPDVAGTVFDDPIPELTRVYAEALLGASGDPDPVLAELAELVADLWHEDAPFRVLLANPGVAASDKDRILVQAFEGRANPIVVNFLRVLNRHGRFTLLEPILRRAQDLSNRRQGRRPAIVRSAVPLADDQKAAVAARIGTMLKAQPIIQYQVDPALLGGLVIQVDDIVYDASVRKIHLEGLRRRLTQEISFEILSRDLTTTSA
jgi:F-type H+-transporting ATPase subunit delta